MSNVIVWVLVFINFNNTDIKSLEERLSNPSTGSLIVSTSMDGCFKAREKVMEGYKDYHKTRLGYQSVCVPVEIVR